MYFFRLVKNSLQKGKERLTAKMIYSIVTNVDAEVNASVLREWLRGGVQPCQGWGRGFESRLALLRNRPEILKTRVSGLF